MAELVEVAIQKALMDRARAFATAQSITISLPNVDFTPPADKSGSPLVYGKWLRATFLPAPSFALEIPDDGNNQHYGILQISVFYGLGAGEYAPKRIAALAAQYFKRGTVVSQDGFSARVYDVPRVSGGLKDDPWWMVPVSIPYRCFA